MTRGFRPIVSRRRFLQTAAASLTLSPFALKADGEELPPITFSVVSDTHLGYRDQASAEQQWKKTAAELREAPGKFVLHLGDVVDGGREAQYGVYRAIRDTIGKPVHEVPGNHDPAALFEKHLRSPIDSAVDQDWLRILLIGNTRFESHDGYLSATQLLWIDEQCEAARKDDRRILLAMHVPAHDNRHPDRGWHVKPNEGQKALYELLDRRKPQVVALFHGHFHNGIRGWSDRAPLHEIVFPSALYNQDRKLDEQKAPGYNLAEFGSGFAQVTLAAKSLRLEYRVVGATERAAKELRRS